MESETPKGLVVKDTRVASEASVARSKRGLELRNRIAQVFLDVNQLITKENDRGRLIQGVCDNLIETMSYSHAWIALIDSSGATTQWVQSTNNAETAAVLAETLDRGELPRCARQTSLDLGLVTTREPRTECPSCSLAGAIAESSGMTVRLELDDVSYGVMAISLPARYLDDTEEQDLFLELASDLSFALRKIDLAESRRDLERQNRQYARIVANTQEAMALVDRDYVFLEVNPSYEALINRSRSEIVGHPVVKVVGRSFFEQRVKPYLERCFVGEEVGFNSMIDLPNGTARFLSAAYSPCREPDGSVSAVVVSIRDITVLKQAEAALQDSVMKFSAMFDHIGIGVSLISPDMEILELNRQMRQWFPNIDPTQHPLCYHAFNDPPRDVPCVYCPTVQTFQDGQVHEAITETPQPDGVRNYRLISSPVLNTQGEVTAVIEMVDDMTERLSLEEQLRQSQKMEAIGLLAGGVAHDFNNQLNVIIGYSDFALGAIEEDSPLSPWLRNIRKAGDSAVSLTKQLLAFSRKQTLELKILDLNDVVTKLETMLRPLIGEDIELVRMLEDDLGHVKADQGQLEQVILNLVINARDAMPDGGMLTIETKNVELNETYAKSHVGVKPGHHVM